MSNRILIVEDDKDISRALTIRLSAAGYEVTAAYDAVLAMSKAVEAQPQLAILDVTMPGGNGFRVAERLRSSSQTAAIPIIFITASRRPEFVERAKELGAAGFFEKPYDAQALVERVHTLMTSADDRSAV